MIVTPLFNQHIGTRREGITFVTIDPRSTPATSSHFAPSVERGLEAEMTLCGIFELERELEKGVP